MLPRVFWGPPRVCNGPTSGSERTPQGVPRPSKEFGPVYLTCGFRPPRSAQTMGHIPGHAPGAAGGAVARRVATPPAPKRAQNAPFAPVIRCGRFLTREDRLLTQMIFGPRRH